MLLILCFIFISWLNTSHAPDAARSGMITGGHKTNSLMACYLGALVEDTRRRHTMLCIPNLHHPEWRLAFYHRHSPPRSSLPTVTNVLAGCERNGWMTDVPAEWIGAESTMDVCTSLAKAVRSFTIAESEGFTAILRLFRAVPLEKHEVLKLMWHDLDWAKAFVGGVVIEQVHPRPFPLPLRKGNPHAA